MTYYFCFDCISVALVPLFITNSSSIHTFYQAYNEVFCWVHFIVCKFSVINLWLIIVNELSLLLIFLAFCFEYQFYLMLYALFDQFYVLIYNLHFTMDPVIFFYKFHNINIIEKLFNDVGYVTYFVCFDLHLFQNWIMFYYFEVFTNSTV